MAATITMAASYTTSGGTTISTAARPTRLARLTHAGAAQPASPGPACWRQAVQQPANCRSSRN
jgi:hypothetical protein